MEGEVVWIELKALRSGVSPRQHRLDRGHVVALAELEGRWPPILVGRNGRRLIDGHHRVAAARMMGWNTIPGVIFDGTAQDAFVEAVRRNVKHGLPLTIDERKVAARRLLGDHPEWSDRRIAQVCALTAHSIGRLRATCGAVELECRVGRDGRRRPVHADSNRVRILEAVQANPEASLRAIAQAVGASPETVRQVRQDLTPQTRRPLRVDTIGFASPTLVGVVGGDRELLTSDARPTSITAVSPAAYGQQFANWFDRTKVGSHWRSHVVAVPLSRVYEVADEARQRAQTWSEFAELVEQRAHTGPAR